MISTKNWKSWASWPIPTRKESCCSSLPSRWGIAPPSSSRSSSASAAWFRTTKRTTPCPSSGRDAVGSGRVTFGSSSRPSRTTKKRSRYKCDITIRYKYSARWKEWSICNQKQPIEVRSRERHHTVEFNSPLNFSNRSSSVFRFVRLFPFHCTYITCFIGTLPKSHRHLQKSRVLQEPESWERSCGIEFALSSHGFHSYTPPIRIPSL
mmetsp:Transcript_19367/g.44912  ORF Transcript_19367/g.44912 Transcript_19367/m.44912 type:complete len:208 (-) Transcript_19367:915-1538(-)